MKTPFWYKAHLDALTTLEHFSRKPRTNSSSVLHAPSVLHAQWCSANTASCERVKFHLSLIIQEVLYDNTYLIKNVERVTGVANRGMWDKAERVFSEHFNSIQLWLNKVHKGDVNHGFRLNLRTSVNE